MSQRKVLIELGRLGDIINILPLAMESDRLGKRLTICVASEFAGLLDGVSYADELVFPGPYDRVADAVSFAARLGQPIHVSQVYGHEHHHERSSESFLRDSWERVGAGKRWEQIPLVFDRREFSREAELAAKVDWSKPVVLVNVLGRSSPFPKAEELFGLISRALPEANVVDLSTIRAHRFYDLLGLFDRASCLVSVDTGTLHLAQASSVPVVALVNPRPWYGSLRRANQLITRPYNQIDPDEIVSEIRKTLPAQKPASLIHVYPEWSMSPEDRRRNQVAALSWESEYKAGWKGKPVLYPDHLVRSTLDLGEKKAVPYLKDLLKIGLNSKADVVVLTNSDVGFPAGVTNPIRRLVQAKGACYSYRYDFGMIEKPLPYPETVSGKVYGGLDLFAFSRSWLKQHFDSLPDMVFGRTHWDLIYRDLVKKTGGGELVGGCWHETHASFWQDEPKTAGNEHNLRLARDWWSKHDSTRPFRHG